MNFLCFTLMWEKYEDDKCGENCQTFLFHAITVDNYCIELEISQLTNSKNV